MNQRDWAFLVFTCRMQDYHYEVQQQRDDVEKVPQVSEVLPSQELKLKKFNDQQVASRYNYHDSAEHNIP